jgi:hypothetical protein
MNTNNKLENKEEKNTQRNSFSSIYFIRNLRLTSQKQSNFTFYDAGVCLSSLYAGLIGSSADNHHIFLYVPTALSAPVAIITTALDKLNSKIMHHSIKKHYKNGVYPVPCMSENERFKLVPNSQLTELEEPSANIYVSSLLQDFRIKIDQEVNYKKKAADAVVRASLESIVCYGIGSYIRNLF